MTTLKTTSTPDTSFGTTTLDLSILWEKYITFADQQKSQHILWWMISLMIHCILVPLTFLLAYTLNGPTGSILGISMILFFINVVANMGGASTRFTILAFFTSLVVHIILASIVFL